MTSLPSKDCTVPRVSSLAIAGAWGYIGRKFLDAASGQAIRVYAFDPRPVPDDIPTDVISICTEDELYHLAVDLFHLALAPTARDRGLGLLLNRSKHEAIAILNEKPMAAPEYPEHCRSLITAIDASQACMLFDFLELFSPLTQTVIDYLLSFERVDVHSIDMWRMKDREDSANPRNFKVMVPIQYQESVHCLAWILYLFARLRGRIEDSFQDVVSIQAESEAYIPPNPKDYPYVLDGRCNWQLKWDDTNIKGFTNFKRNSPWTKRRVILGHGDGKPFKIEAEYQEGRKKLIINEVEQKIDPLGDSYVDVLNTFALWREQVQRKELMRGVFPNPRFAFATYQLSSALWRASYSNEKLSFSSYETLLDFDAGYISEVPNFSLYS